MLWAEQCRRPGSKHPEETIPHLARLSDRGLPRTSEAFSYACSLCDRIIRMDPDSRVRLGGTLDLLGSITSIRDRIDSALACFQPVGLFAAFSGYPSNSRLHEDWLPARKTQRPMRT